MGLWQPRRLDLNLLRKHKNSGWCDSDFAHRDWLHIVSEKWRHEQALDIGLHNPSTKDGKEDLETNPPTLSNLLYSSASLTVLSFLSSASSGSSNWTNRSLFPSKSDGVPNGLCGAALGCFLPFSNRSSRGRCLWMTAEKRKLHGNDDVDYLMPLNEESYSRLCRVRWKGASSVLGPSGSGLSGSLGLWSGSAF